MKHLQRVETVIVSITSACISPGMTSSLPLTSPQPSCTVHLCYVKHDQMHDNVKSILLSYCICCRFL